LRPVSKVETNGDYKISLPFLHIWERLKASLKIIRVWSTVECFSALRITLKIISVGGR